MKELVLFDGQSLSNAPSIVSALGIESPTEQEEGNAVKNITDEYEPNDSNYCGPHPKVE